MAPPFDVILRSRPITFVIGPTQTEFVVHANALTRLSAPLQALLDGNMKEAQEGRVVWDDVDDQTFVRFIQWAYTKDYVTAKPDTLNEASNSEADDDAFNLWRQPERALYSLQDKAVGAPAEHRTCPKGSNYQTYLSSPQDCPGCGDKFYGRNCINCDFCVDEYCLTCRTTRKGTAMAQDFLSKTNWSIFKTRFKPRPNSDPCDDYSVVFLGHASLYIIADKYDIPALRKLSMHRLYQTLKTFTLYPSRMSDILALAALVFENTRDEDELRSMVVHYCACIVEDLSKHKDYRPTLENYNEFCSALMAKMSERLD
ncbi:hypothetical protein PG993_003877 [Apiospora rasikravindrae]|uniref:BTB domain-containing protein n=1 Tax=Apiospora rasikravindrae TaxID=990691 RepID=A0ABR1U1A8_9PEZI